MKSLSFNQIYKIYKHGGSLKEIPIDCIFNALWKHKLQVVTVYDVKNKERIYNFIPEIGKFKKVI